MARTLKRWIVLGTALSGGGLGIAAASSYFHAISSASENAKSGLQHSWFSSLGSIVKTECKKKSHPELNPDEFVPFTLRTIVKRSHDTNSYFFGTEKSHDGIPVSSFVHTKADGVVFPDGKEVVRKYTPMNISLDDGTIELLVKVYPTGLLSKHFGTLKPGDIIYMKGPIEKFKYQANAYKHIGMIAAGTGITPHYQVIQKVLENPQDKTKLTLVYANKTEEDILLRKELDALVKAHPGQIEVHYFIETADSHWQGHVGRIDKDSLAKYLPPPGSNGLVLVCGPSKFNEIISGRKDKTPKNKGKQGELQGYLKDLGYVKEEVFKF